ncbi:hypothetical protein [Actinomadura sp. 3N407]|uniref:hypothetical protein n=1 Tax=Actinomadura sp. 3N407 TaxID=3457423 RepID=UPI003FCDAA72
MANTMLDEPQFNVYDKFLSNADVVGLFLQVWAGSALQEEASAEALGRLLAPIR